MCCHGGEQKGTKEERMLQGDTEGKKRTLEEEGVYGCYMEGREMEVK